MAFEELRTTWEEAIEKLAEERSKAVGVTENEMSSWGDRWGL